MKRMKCWLCLLLCALLCAGCAAPEGEVMETKLTQYVIGQAEYPAYPAFVNAEDFIKISFLLCHTLPRKRGKSGINSRLAAYVKSEFR